MVDDVDQIVPGLWQGGYPARGGALRRNGFDAVVLCAREHQPSGKYFRGIRVFHAPMNDDPAGLTSTERETFLNAASKVCQLVTRGSTVLVTCAAGLNRSGIVSAQALKCMGYTADDAIHLVRQARGDFALFNKAFVNELLSHRFHDRPPEHPLIIRP
jgi:protein-tyrosine phosphatase